MDGVEFWTPTSTRNPISIYQFKWLSYLSCIVQGKKTLFEDTNLTTDTLVTYLVVGTKWWDG